MLKLAQVFNLSTKQFENQLLQVSTANDQSTLNAHANKTHFIARSISFCSDHKRRALLLVNIDQNCKILASGNWQK